MKGRKLERNGKPVKNEIFTLVELLVVIAIIAIIASMLLPALNSAREKGRQSFCRNNMKTINAATFFYVNDNKDFFPSGYGAWQKLISLNYVTAIVIECPSDITCTKGVDFYGYGWQYYKGKYRNFGLLWNMSTGYLPVNYVYWRVGRMANPTLHVYVYDGESGPLSVNSNSYYQGCSDAPQVDLWQLRHQGIANLTFADGHVAGTSRTKYMSEYFSHQQPNY